MSREEHWWWDTDEPNDGGAVNDPEIRHFVARVLTEQAAETPRRREWWYVPCS